MRVSLQVFMLVLLFLPLAGCGDDPHRGHGDDHAELPGVAVTRWTERTELFMEHDVLVAGRPTAFLVHLTILDGFTPVTDGSVTLTLKDAKGKSHVFKADFPVRPGIFRPVATIPEPGSYAMALRIRGTDVKDVHFLGSVEVHADEHAAHASETEEEGEEGIGFLKEQQWQITFMVKQVRERELAETIVALGEVRAPLGRSVPVFAGASGLVREGDGGFPMLGSAVTKGERLVRIISGEASDGVFVTSPVSGMVAVAHVSVGDEVEKGWKLFDLIDLTSVWVEAKVYGSDLPRLPSAARAIVEVTGTEIRFPTSRLISRGGTLDIGSRTASVIFEVDNAKGTLKPGSAVTVNILTKKRVSGPVVPVSALVDEDGAMVAYLQVEGEKFERRQLTLGIREGGWVHVRDGLEVGDRVVTRGAYVVRLAAASSQIPAHGHAH